MRSVKSKLSIVFVAMILGTVSTNASASVVKYGVFGWSSNTVDGCGKGFANIITAQPIKIISRGTAWDRSDHVTAQMRVLSYWYDNDRAELDRVAKTTMIHWGDVAWGETPDEAIAEAERKSMFATERFGCKGPIFRIDMAGFDKLQATTGGWGDVGENRFKLLHTYMNKED